MHRFIGFNLILALMIMLPMTAKSQPGAPGSAPPRIGSPRLMAPIFVDRNEVFLTGSVRSVSGDFPNYRITLRVRGIDFEVRTNRETNFGNRRFRQMDRIRSGIRMEAQGSLDRSMRIIASSVNVEDRGFARGSTITRISYSPRSIEVRDVGGDRRTVLVTSDTEIRGPNNRSIGFEDLSQGDQVIVETHRDYRDREIADRIRRVSGGPRE